MTFYKKLIIPVLGLSLLAGCSKKELNEDSRGVLTADLLYTSQAGFQNGLNFFFAIY